MLSWMLLYSASPTEMYAKVMKIVGIMKKRQSMASTWPLASNLCTRAKGSHLSGRSTKTFFLMVCNEKIWWVKWSVGSDSVEDRPL